MPPRIATSNLDLRAHLASGASISMFCASLHLFLPVTANDLPVAVLFLGRRQFSSSHCYQNEFSCKNRPILPVSCLLSGSIREYQGESGRQAPLQPGLDPAEFAPQQARMEPRRLEMCECGRRSLEGRTSERKAVVGETEGVRQARPFRKQAANASVRPKADLLPLLVIVLRHTHSQ